MLLSGNRPHEALEVLRQWDRESGDSGRSGIRWWTFIDAFHMVGEYEEELQVARRAYRELPDGGAYILRFQARALAALGRVEELNEVLDEIETAPDLAYVRRALQIAVEALGVYGHEGAAEHVAERVAGWFEGRPPEEAAARDHRVRYGRVLFCAGRLDEAQDVLDAVVAEFPDDVNGRGLRAFIAASRGDTAQALSDIEWLSAEGRLEDSLWETEWWRGVIFGALGDREQAVTLIGEAMSKASFYFHADRLLHMEYQPLRDYPAFQELMRPKG